MKQDQETSSDVQVRMLDRGRLFDPMGLFLVGVVGGAGFLMLLHHAWILGLPLVALAALGLTFSHRHFNPPAE